MRYHPDAYVNSIKARVKPHKRPYSQEEELTFSTWAEAHSELIQRREREFCHADKALKAAYRNLKNAHAMKELE